MTLSQNEYVTEWRAKVCDLVQNGPEYIAEARKLAQEQLDRELTYEPGIAWLDGTIKLVTEITDEDLCGPVPPQWQAFSVLRTRYLLALKGFVYVGEMQFRHIDALVPADLQRLQAVSAAQQAEFAAYKYIDQAITDTLMFHEELGSRVEWGNPLDRFLP